MIDTLRVVHTNNGIKVFLNDTRINNLERFETQHTFDYPGNSVLLTLRDVNVQVEHIPDFVVEEEA